MDSDSNTSREESFDFGRLLKKHQKKHKNKPTQFVSVAGGVQKRLENKLKYRKISRLTILDSIRNLSRCASPVSLSEAQQKMEHKKQQLEKWKEEKQKKKEEAASQKKKPFVTGVPHAPLQFVPLPQPSTSGRATRSQTARNSKQVTEKPLSQSFAPKNASFKPPQMKNIVKVPYVNMKINITFDPVLPIIQSEVKQTRSKTQMKPVEAKATRSKPDAKPKGKSTKPLPKSNSKFQSSSSSETDHESFFLLRTRKLLPARRSPVYQSSTETDSSVQSISKPQSSTDSDQSPIRKLRSPIQTRIRKYLPASPIIVSKTRKKEKSFQDTKQFTPKNPVSKSESSSKEKLRTPKQLLNDMLMSPEQIIEEAKKISPCVTMSQGTDNARSEMKKKLDEGLLDEDTSDIDNIEHFRRQLASEIKRLTDVCETWDRISEQTVLPDSIQECVLGAVGQARLLMSQKLQQFASLVERCARPEPGTALVTPADLHGFWDMVFMQVENVDMRFMKLEEMRARGWAEEAPPAPAAPRARPVRVHQAKPAGRGPSRLKEMIAAARKAKKEQLSAPVEKTFEAGFFCVTSPVRSPAPHQAYTPLSKPSLLKAVLSNEANKSASKKAASFAMLRASVLGKSAQCDGIAPLPINAIPGRSILKQASDTVNKSGNKCIKVVLFDQSDTEINSEAEKEPMEEKIEMNVDSGVPSMYIENEEKENSRRKSNRLMRQDATDDLTPVFTCSRRKSSVAPHETSPLKEKTNNQENAPRGSAKS